MINVSTGGEDVQCTNASSDYSLIKIKPPALINSHSHRPLGPSLVPLFSYSRNYKLSHKTKLEI